MTRKCQPSGVAPVLTQWFISLNISVKYHSLPHLSGPAHYRLLHQKHSIWVLLHFYSCAPPPLPTPSNVYTLDHWNRTWKKKESQRNKSWQCPFKHCSVLASWISPLWFIHTNSSCTDFIIRREACHFNLAFYADQPIERKHFLN